MFHRLAQLLSHFCRLPISPSRTRGIAIIKVNPTLLSEQMEHPVEISHCSHLHQNSKSCSLGIIWCEVKTALNLGYSKLSGWSPPHRGRRPQVQRERGGPGRGRGQRGAQAGRAGAGSDRLHEGRHRHQHHEARPRAAAATAEPVGPGRQFD